jgi:hypothetical protein
LAAISSTVATLGCANITTSTETHLAPRGDGTPVQIGDGQEVADRTHGIRWVQVGGDLVVEIDELRQCRALLHRPVVRVETTRRKADYTLAVEWILTAGVAGFATFAFIRPTAFGGRVVDDQGNVQELPQAGYRVGGVFTGIAAIGLFSSIYDTIRTRDTVRYADAYTTELGPEVPCHDEDPHLARTPITLVVDDYEFDTLTNADGRARLRLPPVSRFEDSEGRVVERVVDAAVRVDRDKALRVDFRVPYEGDGLAQHGETDAPIPGAPPS